MTDKPHLLVAASATVVTAAVVGALMTKRSPDAMAERAAEMLSAPPPPAEFGLPDGTKFGTFQNRRGVPIHTMLLRSALPKPKAMAVCLHGICDHSSRPGYGRLYSVLSKSGVDVHAMDLVGHGLSGGERCWVDDFSDWCDDVEDFCVRSRGEGEGGAAPPPLFIVAQSLGANVASHVALRLAASGIPVAGLVLTSPAFGVDMDLVLRVQDFFGSVLDRVAPKAQLVDAVRPEDLTRDPVEVERFRSDPLINHGNLMVHTALMIKRGFESMKRRRGEIECPILVLHGTEDPTTSIASALDFFANVGTPKEKRRFAKLKGFYHEVYNEPERDAALDIIVKFVSSGGDDMPNGEVPRSVGGKEMESVVELDLVVPNK